jgi:hypothetical protein
MVEILVVPFYEQSKVVKVEFVRLPVIAPQSAI